MHELAKLVDALTDLNGEESRLRVVQLQAAEDRALYIVRALTCFYGSVAAFVASRLIGLLGGIAAGYGHGFPANLAFGVGLTIGAVGVVCMISGAMLLVLETRASFEVLREEKKVISHRLRRRAGES